ncbi:hypothetical protein DESC_40021 [Desulfosarcina cetonica]|nr:hypothetical protein DESC_40021 [Desulfosarcina cetonica]
MRPPGDAAGAARTAGHIEDLQHEPDADEKEGRDFHEPGNDDDRNQRQDTGAGIEDEIGTHDAGDGPAGPDGGNTGAGIEDQLGHARSQAAEQVKDGIARRSQSIFDIVAEDVEKPHVADQVHEPAMQEHEGEKGDQFLAGRKVGGNLRIGEFGRHQPVEQQVMVTAAALGQLQQKAYDIDADDGVVDHRHPPGRCGVANGDHGPLSGSMRMLRSTATAEWVRAPMEMRSTPVVAKAFSRSRVTPPETSTRALPAIWVTAWRI